MARLACAEVFDPAEIVAVHLIGKTVRSCYSMGVDEPSGKRRVRRCRTAAPPPTGTAAKVVSAIRNDYLPPMVACIFF